MQFPVNAGGFQIIPADSALSAVQAVLWLR